ncbi:MAG TPA: T9SS type A sorting domain-containing protein, partial [Bacteroidota bacterium]|nr:T9SS type A sorting domain-containing protein [Bacteroidota bacterium]
TAILQNMNSVKITDREGNTQTLYFTELQNNSVSADQVALPPLPPDGVFDARFTSDQFIEVLPEKTSQLSVAIQSSAYPITIQWKITEASLRSLHFFNQLTNAAVPQYIDGQSGTAKIVDPSVKILTLKAERGVAIPTSFALKQNYPNPFNPLTTIEFDVPVRSNITLKVFDILGQQVAVLANNKLYQPGSFSAVFNPSSLASGIYFYQIIANEIDGAHSEYREVKKMMLLK